MAAATTTKAIWSGVEKWGSIVGHVEQAGGAIYAASDRAANRMGDDVRSDYNSSRGHFANAKGAAGRGTRIGAVTRGLAAAALHTPLATVRVLGMLGVTLVGGVAGLALRLSTVVLFAAAAIPALVVMGAVEVPHQAYLGVRWLAQGSAATPAPEAITPAVDVAAPATVEATNDTAPGPDVTAPALVVPATASTSPRLVSRQAPFTARVIAGSAPQRGGLGE